MKKRYCGMCDKWFALRHVECPKCGFQTEMAEHEEEEEDAIRVEGCGAPLNLDALVNGPQSGGGE